MFRKKVLIATMVLLIIVGITSFGLAKDSISEETLTPSVTNSGVSSGNVGSIVAVEADPSRYENEEVGVIVTLVNSGTGITPAEIIEMSSAVPEGQSAENYTTTTGEVVNTKLYTAVTPMYDLGVLTENGVSLDGTPGVVQIKVPEAAGLDGESILIMQINPVTGEIYLITPDAFDSETGELVARFPSYGPFMLISKVPLVDKVPSPELYPNKDVADIVESCSVTEYLSLEEWMLANGETGNTLSFEVPVSEDSDTSGSLMKTVDAAGTQKTKTVTVNVNDYEAVTLLSDVTIRLGTESFNYNLSTRIKAKLYQDLDRANWTKILKYAGVSYDLNEIKKNPSLLQDIEPFVLKDAFVYHIDAATGEVSFVYEPTISFDTYKDEIGDHIELQENQDNISGSVQLPNLFENRVYAEMKTVDKSKVSWFYVDDIDEDNTANLNMVISGDGYIGMGPFILFMPDSGSTFSWGWILAIILILALIIAGAVVYRQKKVKG